MTQKSEKLKNKKLKFEDYNYFLEATQFKIKINQLEKTNLMWIVLEFIKRKQQKKKNSKLILKTLQKFRSDKHNVFTEEVIKIALRAKDDERIQSLDSIETSIWNKKRPSM